MSDFGKLVTFAPRHRCSPPQEAAAQGGAAGRIAAFLAEDSDGGELLHALYDHVLDEPIPPAMLALVRQ
ncbi:MAG TPA: hypothetical protein VGM07_12925 [Stellaceae bacterium]|jgi:hypothetical protein